MTGQPEGPARVLVTGGASNVGRGIVHGFAAAGARVLICDIDGEQAGRVQSEAMRKGAADCAVAIQDLTEEGAGKKVVEHLAGLWGGIDVLVNNAGWSSPGFIAEDTDRQRWQRFVDTNLFSAIDCTQAAIARMRESGGGAIVFISSDAAYGEIRQGVYGTTKAGLIALARTVAKEHGKHGIRSNVVCPGLVLPDGAEAVGEGSLWSAGRDAVFNEDQVAYMIKRTPLRRLTTAQDIADAVVWMSSKSARQVTGQVLSVSGGYSMP